MIVKTIVCDRCVVKIEEPHPCRLDVMEWKEVREKNEHSKSGYTEKRFYSPTSKFHLCDKCRRELYYFIRYAMQGGEKNEPENCSES